MPSAVGATAELAVLLVAMPWESRPRLVTSESLYIAADDRSEPVKDLLGDLHRAAEIFVLLGRCRRRSSGKSGLGQSGRGRR